MPVRGQRLARLLKLIALLRGPSSWHAQKLAGHFATSRRNVHRDLAVLRMAGVPVYRDEEYGLGGSYRIAREFWFPTVCLTDQECLDLSVLTRAAENRTIPLLESVCEVRDKLMSTLPAKQQDLIRDASELFEVLSLGLAEHGHCTKIMLAFQQSLLTRKKVEVTYRSPHEKRAKKLRLQPRRVFLARQSWYVAAHDDSDQRDKLFRLARFTDVKLVKDPITVAQEWSLKEMLGNAWGVLKGERDHYVEIHFDAWAAELVGEVRWHETQKLLRQADGTVIFHATVAGLDEVKWWVLGWGPHARVTKPKELAEEMRRLAAETLRQYTPQPRQPNRRRQP